MTTITYETSFSQQLLLVNPTLIMVAQLLWWSNTRCRVSSVAFLWYDFVRVIQKVVKLWRRWWTFHMSFVRTLSRFAMKDGFHVRGARISPSSRPFGMGREHQVSGLPTRLKMYFSLAPLAWHSGAKHTSLWVLGSWPNYFLLDQSCKASVHQSPSQNLQCSLFPVCHLENAHWLWMVTKIGAALEQTENVSSILLVCDSQ